MPDNDIENYTIRMWAFEDAPAEYRALSKHGGDEDWIVFVPVACRDYYMPWLEEGMMNNIGCAAIDVTLDADGNAIYIGAHA